MSRNPIASDRYAVAASPELQEALRKTESILDAMEQSRVDFLAGAVRSATDEINMLRAELSRVRQAAKVALRKGCHNPRCRLSPCVCWKQELEFALKEPSSA